VRKKKGQEKNLLIGVRGQWGKEGKKSRGQAGNNLTDLWGQLGCWVSPGPWNPRTGFFGWCTGGCWVTQATFRWAKGA